MDEPESGLGMTTKKPAISRKQILYAGLGALERRSSRDFDELTRAGRAIARESRPGAAQELERLAQEVADLLQEIERAEEDPALGEEADDRYEVRLPTFEIAESVQAAPPAGRMPAMVEAMMPLSIPTAPAVLQARRNAGARAELIEEFGLLSSADVADLSQSQAANRAALASRWKAEERIFSVPHQGRDYFPGFQLDADGKPRKVIAEILGALGRARGWQTALWFTAANGYLDGQRPVDLLESDAEAVVDAARYEGGEVYF